MKTLLIALLSVVCWPVFGQGWTLMGEPVTTILGNGTGIICDEVPAFSSGWGENMALRTNCLASSLTLLPNNGVNVSWSIVTNRPATVGGNPSLTYSVNWSGDGSNWVELSTVVYNAEDQAWQTVQFPGTYISNGYFTVNARLTDVTNVATADWTYTTNQFGSTDTTNIYVNAVTGNDSTGQPGFTSLPFKTVQAALSHASIGSVVNVSAGTFDFPTAMTPLYNMSLVGDSTAGTIFQRSGLTSSLHVFMGGLFKNFTLLSATPTNGSTPFWVDSTFTITNLTFADLSVFGDTDCTIGQGMGYVYNWTVTNSTFTSGYDCLNWNVPASVVYFTNSVFEPIRNPDHDHGNVRGLWIRSGLFSINNCTISASNALSVNDALHMDNGVVSITNSTLISVSTNCTPYKVRITGGILNFSGVTVSNSEVFQTGGTINRY